MMYEVRFIDNTGKFRVASAVPADKLEMVIAIIERIAQKFSIETVNTPGWLR